MEEKMYNNWKTSFIDRLSINQTTKQLMPIRNYEIKVIIMIDFILFI